MPYTDAVMLIRRFGSVLNPDIPFHPLFLNVLYVVVQTLFFSWIPGKQAGYASCPRTSFKTSCYTIRKPISRGAT